MCRRHRIVIGEIKEKIFRPDGTEQSSKDHHATNIWILTDPTNGLFLFLLLMTIIPVFDNFYLLVSKSLPPGGGI